MQTRTALPLTVSFLGLFTAAAVSAQPAAPPPSTAAAAAPTSCQAAPGAKCCDPAVAAHLTKESIFLACGEGPATYLGEKGSKDTCRYLFKDSKGEESFVEVYAPAQKEVPSEPSDPFFGWKKVGKVFITHSAKSPKSAPMLANSTGLWLPGNGYTVSVNASTKVCTKAEATKLAKSVK
ncbi:MAG TPA: hypothetical protein VGF45_05505 [Polyangia bacterium]